MKILIIALSTGNAMGQYLEALIPILTKHCDLHIIVPQKNPLFLGEANVYRVDTGSSIKSSLYKFVNFFEYSTIPSIINGINPTVVHIFNAEGYPWNLAASEYCKKNIIPYVLTLHDPIPHPGNIFEFLNGLLRKKVIKNASVVHIHSDKFIHETYQLGAKKIKVIPHGSIAGRYLKYCDSFDGRVINEKYILFFGRLEKYKGLEYLIEALEFIDPDVCLVIAGQGKLPKNLKSSNNVNRIVIKNNYIPDWQVANLLYFSNALVLPYIQASQSSLPAIASEFRIPLVGTNVGALGSEILQHGGYVVEPKEVYELAIAINTVLQNPPISSYEKVNNFEILIPQFIDMYEYAFQSYNVI